LVLNTKTVVQQNTIEPLHDNWNALKKKLSLTLVTRSFILLLLHDKAQILPVLCRFVNAHDTRHKRQVVHWHIRRS